MSGDNNTFVIQVDALWASRISILSAGSENEAQRYELR